MHGNMLSNCAYAMQWHCDAIHNNGAPATLANRGLAQHSLHYFKQKAEEALRQHENIMTGHMPDGLAH